MKIAIIEIMPRGHYTLVDALIRIFCSDPANQIVIVTQEEGASILSQVIARYKGQITIHLIKEDIDLSTSLSLLQREWFDRIYITTLEKYFKEIDKIMFSGHVYLFIHNIDDWFGGSVFIHTYRMLSNFSLSKKFVYTCKINILYPFLRRRIIQKVRTTQGRFVVLAPNMKKELEKHIDPNLIEIIPFSVYDKHLINKSENKKIRICIPGMISPVRRDYDSVLKMIKKNIELFRKSFEFDLLGFISNNDGGQKVVEEFLKLKALGLTIYSYKQSMLPAAEFDEQLSKADIILGNINVIVDKYSSYGITKESGLPFAMIRAAKPGLLIAGYTYLEDLTSSTMVFNDYNELYEILKSFTKGKTKLNQLKKAAKLNSEKYSPARIYKNLISSKP
jgi:hypothetical protein